MNLIVNALLEGIYFLASAITNFLYILPDAQLSTAIASNVSGFGVMLRLADGIVSFEVIAQCLFLFVSFWIGVGLFKFIKWGLSLIPFL